MEKTTEIFIAKPSRFAQAKAFAGKAALIGATALATSPVFAADDTWGLQTYIDAAQANVKLVIAGVIALAALGFGVGYILTHLRK